MANRMRANGAKNTEFAKFLKRSKLVEAFQQVLENNTKAKNEYSTYGAKVKHL